MAIFKPTSGNTPASPKKMPKRGSKTLKASPIIGDGSEVAMINVDTASDAHLQSPHCHRRYMRRGSRAPSMFISIPPLSELLLEHDDGPDSSDQQPRCKRRMSLVSLLGQQFQEEAVLSSPRQPADADMSKLAPRPLKLQREQSVPTNE